MSEAFVRIDDSLKIRKLFDRKIVHLIPLRFAPEWILVVILKKNYWHLWRGQNKQTEEIKANKQRQQTNKQTIMVGTFGERQKAPFL